VAQPAEARTVLLLRQKLAAAGPRVCNSMPSYVGHNISNGQCRGHYFLSGSYLTTEYCDWLLICALESIMYSDTLTVSLVAVS